MVVLFDPGRHHRPGLGLGHEWRRRSNSNTTVECHDSITTLASAEPGRPIAGRTPHRVKTCRNAPAVNSLPRILDVAPGLHTMRDMPLPAFFGGRRS